MIAKREATYSANGHLGIPLVTKEEIQEVDSLVVKAKQMVDEVMEKHNNQALRRDKLLSQATQDAGKPGVKTAKLRRVDKGAFLPPKPLPKQRLTGERIKKRVNEYEADLQRSMANEPTRDSSKKSKSSHDVCRSPISLELYDTTQPLSVPQAPDDPETPQKPSSPKLTAKVDMVTLKSGDTIPIVVSPTGFARFPRHCDDDDEWDRLSQSSVPDKDGNTNTENKPSSEKDPFTS